MKRCEECGSWEAECGSDEPVADCGCARCAVAARDKALSELFRAKLACNNYWHDLERIASLCGRTADEYPLKAVMRVVAERDRYREKAESLEDRCSIAEGDLYRVKVERDALRWESEMSCENTPTASCECPGCETARERAKKGEVGP